MDWGREEGFPVGVGAEPALQGRGYLARRRAGRGSVMVVGRHGRVAETGIGRQPWVSGEVMEACREISRT